MRIKKLTEIRKRKLQQKRGSTPAVDTSHNKPFKLLEQQSELQRSFYQHYKDTQISAIKQLSLVDYCNTNKGDPKTNTIREKTFKQLMLDTLNRGSTPKVITPLKQSLVFLDNIIDQEEQMTGRSPFNRGLNLRKGLINVDEMYGQIMKSQMKGKDMKHELSDHSFQIHILPQIAVSEKEKWRVVMKYMENNPSLMLDLMPSPRQFVMPSQKDSKVKQKLQQNLDQSREIESRMRTTSNEDLTPGSNL